MDQVHKRFTAEQIKVLLKGYCQGILDRPAIEETLGISRSAFILLLKEYRRNPDEFSLTYYRETPTRIPARVEKEIEAELMLEKGLIEDPSLPISGYNYSAITDRLAKHDIKIALSTIEFQDVEERQAKQDRAIALPDRIPTMCVGCPHRGSACAVRRVLKDKGVKGSDIGCYGMLRREPWQLTDWSICMGGGIGVAQGMSHKLEAGPLISFIGDSTFFHAGLEPVLNAAYYDSDVLLIILDNRWTSMTGHQPTQSTLEDMAGQPMKTIPIKDILQGLGVKQICVANPFKPNNMVEIIKEALKQFGFRVLISEGECILQTQRRQRLTGIPAKIYTIDPELCSQRGLCYEFTCTAVGKRTEDSVVEYYRDSGLYAGCGACVSICPRKMLITSEI